MVLWLHLTEKVLLSRELPKGSEPDARDSGTSAKFPMDMGNIHNSWQTDKLNHRVSAEILKANIGQVPPVQYIYCTINCQNVL